jgi:hypothetical protein
MAALLVVAVIGSMIGWVGIVSLAVADPTTGWVGTEVALMDVLATIVRIFDHLRVFLDVLRVRGRHDHVRGGVGGVRHLCRVFLNVLRARGRHDHIGGGVGGVWCLCRVGSF